MNTNMTGVGLICTQCGATVTSGIYKSIRFGPTEWQLTDRFVCHDCNRFIDDQDNAETSNVKWDLKISTEYLPKPAESPGTSEQQE